MAIHLPVFENPRPPIIGNIKVGGLGEVRQGANGPYRLPVKYDHFVITKRQRQRTKPGEARGDLIVDEALMKMMPRESDGKVRRIPCKSWSDDIEEVFPTRLALYNGPRVQCSGDGIEAMWQKALEDGRVVGVERRCPCKYYKAKGKWRCKPHGTFYPEVQAGELTKTGAVHAFRTTGTLSINNITTSLEFIRRDFGSLRGAPLWMVVTQIEMDVEGVGITTVPVVHIECVEKDRIALMERMIALAQKRHEVEKVLGIQHIKLGLPAPGSDEETPEEKAAITEEFHPQDVEGVIDAFYREAETSQDSAPEEPPEPQDEPDAAARSTRRDTQPDMGRDTPPDTEPRGQRTRHDADHQSHADTLAGSFDASAPAEDAGIPAPPLDENAPEPEQSALRGEVGKLLQQVVEAQKPPIDVEKYSRARTYFFTQCANGIFGQGAPTWKLATKTQLEAIRDKLEDQVERIVLQGD